MSKSDLDHLLTKLVVAMIELRAGNPQTTARIANDIRDDTVKLRRAELWRNLSGSSGVPAARREEQRARHTARTRQLVPSVTPT